MAITESDRDAQRVRADAAEKRLADLRGKVKAFVRSADLHATAGGAAKLTAAEDAWDALWAEVEAEIAAERRAAKQGAKR